MRFDENPFGGKEMGIEDVEKKLLFEKSFLLQKRAEFLAENDRQLQAVEDALRYVRKGGTVSWNGDVMVVSSPPAEIPPTGEFGDSLMRAIHADGTLDYGQLAKEIFGRDDKVTQQRVRNGLNHLRRKGFIIRTATRTWELVKKKRRGRPPKAPPVEPEE
jgi:hypothetical protein